MKNKAYKWIVGLLAGSLLISPLLPVEVEAASQAAPSLSINGGTAQGGEVEIRGGRTYIAAQAASERLGFRVDYNRGSKLVTLLRPDTTLKMTLGRAEADIDGKRVKIGAAAFVENGQVYVPVQALASALKSKSGWKAEAKTVTLGDPGRYAIHSEGGQTVWVSFAKGEVYSLEAGAPKKLAGANVSGLDWGTVDVRALGSGSYLLSVGREYVASSQTVHNRFQFVVQKGKVTKQAHYRYSGMYNTDVFGPKTLPAQRAYVSDGRTVQVVGAGGRAAADYDLAKLTKQTGPFIVESVTADYLLVRAFDTLQPTVIDLNTGRSSLLYKTLLGQGERAEWDEVTTDVGERVLLQARLRFVKQEGNRLDFTYKKIASGPDQFGREFKVSYTLKPS